MITLRKTLKGQMSKQKIKGGESNLLHEAVFSEDTYIQTRVLLCPTVYALRKILSWE